MKDLKLADGRARVVRHGHGPVRTIQTGIGPVEVARAKIRDRGTAGDGKRIRFSSAMMTNRPSLPVAPVMPIMMRFPCALG